MGGALVPSHSGAPTQKAESLPKVQGCANSRRAEPVLGTEGGLRWHGGHGGSALAGLEAESFALSGCWSHAVTLVSWCASFVAGGGGS